MPAASEVGVVGYVDIVLAEEAGLRKLVQDALAHLGQSSQARRGRSFGKLSSAERVRLLENLEGVAGGADSGDELFATMLNLVYEAYYTSPKVWPKIGYRFYATDELGPDMKPFDESVLAKVRKMPKLYRDVP